jgi:hypothetical protein
MHKNRYIEDIKFELKTFQFAHYMFNFAFREYLQFERACRKFQRLIKSKEKRARERERRKGGAGVWADQKIKCSHWTTHNHFNLWAA